MLQSQPLDIVYEDNHLIVVNKPEGVPSQPDKSAAPDMLGLLKRFLVERDQKKGDAWLGLVHRLDRPTSGLMVFAKTSKAASRLSEAFRGRDVKKYYVALVRGVPNQERGTFRDILSAREIEGRVRVLSLDHKNNEKTHDLIKSSKGKLAELTWAKIASNSQKSGDESLLFIELHTGRRHQIRAQFAERGFPIAGDRRYGLNDARDLELPTLALHACGLVFPHPTKKTMMAFYIDPSINPSFQNHDADALNRFLKSMFEEGNLMTPAPHQQG